MQSFFHGISFRLAKVGVVLALIVGFLMSAIQIFIDYQAQTHILDAQINRIIKVASLPAARAAYTVDYNLAEEVSQGLIEYEFVTKVAIQDDLGDVLSRQARDPEISSTRGITRLFSDEIVHFNAPLMIQDSPDPVGTIQFSVDMDQAFSPFYQHAALVISIGLIRSSVLVLCLFIAFYYLLTKPLIRLSTEIKEINPGSPGEQRLSYPESSADDELKQLAITANQLLDAVDIALAKRRAVEVVLRKSEEHVRQIIDSLPVWVGARNRDGHYIFANKALAAFMQTSSDLMRGSHISEYQRYFTTSAKEVNRIDAEVIDSKTKAHILDECWLDSNGDERHMQTHIMPMEFYDETVALIVSSDITELKVAQDLMAHMAYHDTLTGLPNRSYLIERLEEELQRASALNNVGALLFIDLDQFKNINDSLGHPAGDSVLMNVSERLSHAIAPADIVVRLGGDEFVVVLIDLSDAMPAAILRAEGVAERLRKHVSEPYFYQDLELHVTCSVGIVMFPDENSDVHELLRYADTAMYQVKDQGRDAIEFFNKHMADSAKNILVMEGDLHKALEDQRFSLHFQPRVNIETGMIVGAEALLRWDHPQRGMVSPVEFIPILESSGLIVSVGMWVLEHSMTQVKQWVNQGLWSRDMRLGVNISPRQFRSASFVDDVAKLLKHLDFSPNMLEMEITEGIVIQNLDITIETMSTLGELGVKFALDDFGTGYSSISYLKQLPVSVLKIDKSFIRDINDDRNDRVLVETITAMGNMLDLHVVAEGVETPEQLSLLKEYKCGYYQGYLSSKPVPAPDFLALLDKA